MFDRAVEQVLKDYNARLENELATMERFPPGSEGAPDVNSLLLAVGEETGQFLHSLAMGLRPKHILEIGTSFGYSTLFLAAAARATGGRVTTLELSGDKQAYAQSMLARAGLAGYVDWLAGDALDHIAGLKGPFDMVLLDLWKELYVPCLELFYPKLANQAVIVADNMLWPKEHHKQAALYRAAVEAKEDLDCCLLPIGSGILVSSRL